jgi:hypothetical protein
LDEDAPRISSDCFGCSIDWSYPAAVGADIHRRLDLVE